MSDDDTRFDDRMSDSDNLLWAIEQNPLLRSTITAVTFLAAPPDRGRLQRRIDRATRRIPRLRQRVVANPLSIAPPRWEGDPNFNLSYHLRWADLGGRGTVRDVLELVEPIAMQGFDRARPLWEFTLVDGLADGGAALVMKVHHAVTDGVGAVKLMLELFSLTPEDCVDDEEMPDPPPVEVLGQAQRVRHAVDHELRRSVRALRETTRAARRFELDPVGSARDLASTLTSLGRLAQPSPRPLSPLMTERSLSLHLDVLHLPIDALRAASARADVKLNAAFVAGVCRAMHRFHADQGEIVSHLRMGMPISRRNGSDAHLAGNQFTPVRFVVPIDIEDPVEHMQTLDRLARRQRDEPGHRLIEPAAAVLRRLPTTVTTSLFAAALQGIDFLTSNVPGVGFPVYLEGVEIRSLVPFGPLSGAAVNVTLLSYVDRVSIGINLDPVAVGDPDRLRGALETSFAELTG